MFSVQNCRIQTSQVAARRLLQRPRLQLLSAGTANLWWTSVPVAPVISQPPLIKRVGILCVHVTGQHMNKTTTKFP